MYWYSLYCLLQGCHMRCQYCHNPDTGLWSPMLRERTVDTSWQRPCATVVSGEIRWITAVEEKLFCRLISWLLSSLHMEQRIHCTLIPRLFLSVINHVTLRSLTNSWLSLTWFFWISLKSTKNSTRLSLDKLIKISWLVPSIYQILENLFDSPRASSRIDRQRWWLD